MPASKVTLDSTRAGRGRRGCQLHTAGHPSQSHDEKCSAPERCRKDSLPHCDLLTYNSRLFLDSVFCNPILPEFQALLEDQWTITKKHVHGIFSAK